MGFDFTKEWVLENNEVTLRPLEITHTAELHGISDDPVIWAYLMERGQTLQDLEKYITCAVEERKNRVSYPFVVIDKPTGRIAGTTRLYEMNQTLGSVKVGHTWYGASFRGSGINTAVKCLLFEFVFERLGLARVGFGVHEKNGASIRALKKVGAVKEGVLRSFLPDTLHASNSRRYDIVLFSLLKEEWEAGIKDSLQIQIKKTEMG